MPEKAILVIDVQNEFAEPGGKFYSPRIGAIVPRIAKLLKEARRKGIPIIYTQDTQREDRPSMDVKKHGMHCKEGSWGWRIVEGVKPEKGDIIIRKREYSAFFRTQLRKRLEELGVKSLIITGTTTGCCVSATVQDAFARGYSITIVGDCVDAPTKEEHEQGLRDLSFYYGEVKSLSEVIKEL